MAVANKINDFTITEFIDLDAFSRTTGILEFNLEQLTDLTVTASQEVTEVNGKNGTIIQRKKRNKSVTGTGTHALISAPLMAAQTGGEVENGTFTVRKSETKVVSGATVVTDAVATGTAGAEIGAIKTLNSVGATDNTYTQGATADATHFAYDPETKTITLPVDNATAVIADGTTIVYAYDRTVSGTRVKNPADKFSKTMELWIHCFGTDACDNEYYADIHIPRADIDGNFDLALASDQTVQNFSFTSLPDLCNTAAGSDLYELIIYTDEAE